MNTVKDLSMIAHHMDGLKLPMGKIKAVDLEIPYDEYSEFISNLMRDFIGPEIKFNKASIYNNIREHASIKAYGYTFRIFKNPQYNPIYTPKDKDMLW